MGKAAPQPPPASALAGPPVPTILELDGPDAFVSESYHRPEDVFYVGSDDEYYESSAQRTARCKDRYESFVRSSFQRPPTIMTATLRGPFDSGVWQIPWRSRSTNSASIASRPKTNSVSIANLPRTKATNTMSKSKNLPPVEAPPPTVQIKKRKAAIAAVDPITDTAVDPAPAKAVASKKARTTKTAVGLQIPSTNPERSTRRQLFPPRSRQSAVHLGSPDVANSSAVQTPGSLTTQPPTPSSPKGQKPDQNTSEDALPMSPSELRVRRLSQNQSVLSGETPSTLGSRFCIPVTGSQQTKRRTLAVDDDEDGFIDDSVIADNLSLVHTLGNRALRQIAQNRVYGNAAVPATEKSPQQPNAASTPGSSGIFETQQDDSFCFRARNRGRISHKAAGNACADGQKPEHVEIATSPSDDDKIKQAEQNDNCEAETNDNQPILIQSQSSSRPEAKSPCEQASYHASEPYIKQEWDDDSGVCGADETLVGEEDAPRQYSTVKGRFHGQGDFVDRQSPIPSQFAVVKASFNASTAEEAKVPSQYSAVNAGLEDTVMAAVEDPVMAVEDTVTAAFEDNVPAHYSDHKAQTMGAISSQRSADVPFQFSKLKVRFGSAVATVRPSPPDETTLLHTSFSSVPPRLSQVRNHGAPSQSPQEPRQYSEVKDSANDSTPRRTLPLQGSQSTSGAETPLANCSDRRGSFLSTPRRGSATTSPRNTPQQKSSPLRSPETSHASLFPNTPKPGSAKATKTPQPQTPIVTCLGQPVKTNEAPLEDPSPEEADVVTEETEAHPISPAESFRLATQEQSPWAAVNPGPLLAPMPIGSLEGQRSPAISMQSSPPLPTLRLSTLGQYVASKGTRGSPSGAPQSPWAGADTLSPLVTIPKSTLSPLSRSLECASQELPSPMLPSPSRKRKAQEDGAATSSQISCRPSTPQDQLSSLPTPELTNSIKPFRRFLSPRKPCAVAEDPLANPWAAEPRRPAKRVRWALLPGEESAVVEDEHESDGQSEEEMESSSVEDDEDDDDYIEAGLPRGSQKARNVARAKKTAAKALAATASAPVVVPARPKSPPPPSRTSADYLPSEVTTFQKYFSRVDSHALQQAWRPRPASSLRDADDGDEEQASQPVDAVARRFVAADAAAAKTAKRPSGGLKRSSVAPSSSAAWQHDEDVSTVLDNLDDFLGCFNLDQELAQNRASSGRVSLGVGEW